MDYQPYQSMTDKAINANRAAMSTLYQTEQLNYMKQKNAADNEYRQQQQDEQKFQYDMGSLWKELEGHAAAGDLKQVNDRLRGFQEQNPQYKDRMAKIAESGAIKNVQIGADKLKYSLFAGHDDILKLDKVTGTVTNTGYEPKKTTTTTTRKKSAIDPKAEAAAKKYLAQIQNAGEDFKVNSKSDEWTKEDWQERYDEYTKLGGFMEDIEAQFPGASATTLKQVRRALGQYRPPLKSELVNNRPGWANTKIFDNRQEKLWRELSDEETLKLESPNESKGIWPTVLADRGADTDESTESWTQVSGVSADGSRVKVKSSAGEIKAVTIEEAKKLGIKIN